MGILYAIIAESVLICNRIGQYIDENNNVLRITTNITQYSTV